jgi:hypothetical protein
MHTKSIASYRRYLNPSKGHNIVAKRPLIYMGPALNLGTLVRVMDDMAIESKAREKKS